MSPRIASNYTDPNVARIDKVRGAWTREQFQNTATMEKVKKLEAVPPSVPVGTWRDHIGISITNPGPQDVSRLLEYGAWARAGFEECWNLNDFAGFMNEANRQGLKVLACIQPCVPRYKGWDIPRYLRFGDFSVRVADLGVHAIEAGNELNLSIFNQGDLNQCAYTAAQLVAAVAGAVHAKHPTIPVISNGWSPHGDPPSNLYPQNALAYMLPLTTLADGYGYHPYEMKMKPSQSTTTPGWNACWWISAAWASIVAKGASKPMWLTEFGKHGSDADQEIWMRDYFKAFNLHRSAGVKIANVFWHTLYEGQSTTSAAENTMGILRKSGSSWVRKPAANTLVELGKAPF